MLDPPFDDSKDNDKKSQQIQDMNNLSETEIGECVFMCVSEREMIIIVYQLNSSRVLAHQLKVSVYTYQTGHGRSACPQISSVMRAGSLALAFPLQSPSGRYIVNIPKECCKLT